MNSVGTFMEDKMHLIDDGDHETEVFGNSKDLNMIFSYQSDISFYPLRLPLCILHGFVKFHSFFLFPEKRPVSDSYIDF